jgi:8-oxo-dGTP pyrophosphatase MutT (NUDIX family)
MIKGDNKMRLIENFNLDNDADCTSTFSRTAVRAIIYKDGKLVMVKSTKFGEYKFPGGGKDDGESDLETLERETKEETGMTVIPASVQAYGYTKEKRRSVFNPSQRFIMESRYYLCNVMDHIEETDYDPYEKDYGYHLCVVTIDEAIEQNVIAAEKHQEIATWIQRELTVLKDIKKHL